MLAIAGAKAAELFLPERGGHRYQRVPVTERKGRKQSSTVTVSVFGAAQAAAPVFRLEDVEIKYCVASVSIVISFVIQSSRSVEIKYCVASVGAGGQARQKNATACQVQHLPTGTRAQCEDERSQKRNRDKALRTLRQRVEEAARSKAASDTNDSRRSQIGSGKRGDKIRTVQVHNGVVTNHITGKKLSLESYLKGYIEDVQ